MNKATKKILHKLYIGNNKTHIFKTLQMQKFFYCSSKIQLTFMNQLARSDLYIYDFYMTLKFKKLIKTKISKVD